MQHYDNPPSSTGVQSAPTQAFETPKVDRLEWFTDAELLGELWRRKRLVEVHATESVDDCAMQRYQHEEGFWQTVKKSTFRSIGAWIANNSDELSHHTMYRRPEAYCTDYRRSIWIITRPTGGRIE